MSKLTETAPPEIHLCISDENGDDVADFSAFDHEHTIWAEEAAVKNTVHYIRADLTERQAPCKTHCEAQAFQIVIRQQHQALLDASIALIEAASAISYYGPNPHQKSWQEDAQEAQDAAAKATSVAMSGVQPAAS